MEIDIVHTCPLGSQCEEIKDGKLHRCRWYVKLQGVDPQTGDPIDEFRCTEEWNVILGVEHSMFERQTGAAVESFRNETSKHNRAFLSIISGATKRVPDKKKEKAIEQQ